MWMVSFTLVPLYSRGNSPLYAVSGTDSTAGLEAEENWNVWSWSFQHASPLSVRCLNLSYRDRVCNKAVIAFPIAVRFEKKKCVTGWQHLHSVTCSFNSCLLVAWWQNWLKVWRMTYKCTVYCRVTFVWTVWLMILCGWSVVIFLWFLNTDTRHFTTLHP